MRPVSLGLYRRLSLPLAWSACLFVTSSTLTHSPSVCSSVCLSSSINLFSAYFSKTTLSPLIFSHPLRLSCLPLYPLCEVTQSRDVSEVSMLSSVWLITVTFRQPPTTPMCSPSLLPHPAHRTVVQSLAHPLLFITWPPPSCSLASSLSLTLLWHVSAVQPSLSMIASLPTLLPKINMFFWFFCLLLSYCLIDCLSICLYYHLYVSMFILSLSFLSMW